MVTKGINVVLFLIFLGFVHPTFHRATCAGPNFSHSSNKRNKKMQKFDQLSATYVHQQVPTGEPITLQKKKKCIRQFSVPSSGGCMHSAKGSDQFRISTYTDDRPWSLLLTVRLPANFKSQPY